MPTSRQAVLFFDLDGALIDSKAGIRIALNAAMDEWGLVHITDAELAHIVGPPFQTTVPVLLTARDVSTDRTMEFIETYRRIYGGGVIQQTPLMPGVKDALDTLRASWPLAIVTSKPEPQARIVLESTGVLGHFDVIVGSPPDESTKKAVLLAHACDLIRDMHNFHAKHQRSWMIGDRHHDIDAAVEEGVSSIGVLWGYGSRKEFETAGATHIIVEPAELLELLK